MPFDLETFTLIHVAISLVGVGSGLIAVLGWISGRRLAPMTGLFLLTTLLTSVTGFMFPFERFTPAHGVGILSLVILAVNFYARYAQRLEGRWRGIFVVTSVVALYFNFFVLVVQSFQKVPSLKELAPNQTEPPFGIAQGVTLVVFVVLGILATKRYPATAPQAR